MSNERTRTLQFTLVQARKMIPKDVVAKNYNREFTKVIETLENVEVDYEFPTQIVEKINTAEEVIKEAVANFPVLGDSEKADKEIDRLKERMDEINLFKSMFSSTD